MRCEFGKGTQAYRDGKTFLVDDDVDLSEYSFYMNCSGYVVFSSRKDGLNRTRLHRWIMKCPDDKYIDHINNDPLDNRRCNLRVCSHQENMFNTLKRCDNTSGYKGVSLHKPKNKYRARININGKRITLGYFNTAEEAYEAYCEKGKEIQGEFFNSGEKVA